MIAALFVAKGGCYFGLPDVDPWDEERDARLYAGPWPVVAHPPCERWGRYANGGPGFRGTVRPLPGDDMGCFECAIASVRRWGGVLEHPAHTAAWCLFGLSPPPPTGWAPRSPGPALMSNGWVCQVDQGHYGHRARKSTWLYVVGPRPAELVWGPSTPAPSVNSTPQVLPPGRRASRTGIVQRMSHNQRRATPIPFRDLLIEMARKAGT